MYHKIVYITILSLTCIKNEIYHLLNQAHLAILVRLRCLIFGGRDVLTSVLNGSDLHLGICSTVEDADS